MDFDKTLPISRILQFVKDTQANKSEWIIGIKISPNFAQRVADTSLEDLKTSRDNSLPIEQHGTSNTPESIFADFRKLKTNAIKNWSSGHSTFGSRLTKSPMLQKWKPSSILIHNRTSAKI